MKSLCFFWVFLCVDLSLHQLTTQAQDTLKPSAPSNLRRGSSGPSPTPTSAGSLPTSVTVRASYPTQTVLCGTVNPASSYSISVTADSALIHDVNPSLFAGSNIDTGRPDTTTIGNERCIIIGHRAYAPASNGAIVSRATEVDKLHSYNWGGTTGTFTTPTIPLNNSASDPLPGGPDGETLTPTLNYGDRNAFYIDAFTGARVKHWDLPGQQRVYSAWPFSVSEQGTGWSNVSNALSDADSSAYASFSGTSQSWLYLHGPVPYPSQQLGENPSADNYGLILKGYCSGSDCSNLVARVVDAQMTFDGVNWSPTYQLTLPNGSEGTVTSYGPTGATATPGSFWITPDHFTFQQEWGSGLIYTSGTSATAFFTNAGDCSAVRTGDVIYARGVNFTVVSTDCASTPKRMTFNFSFDLAPPSGVSGWPFRYTTGLFQNSKIGFRIRKNSTTHANAQIRIQYAAGEIHLSDTSRSSSGGFAEHCNRNLTEHGRHLCVFGDRLYSVDPVTGNVIFLSSSYMRCGGNQARVFGSEGGVWSTTNPRRMYVAGMHDGGDSLPSLLRIDITQDDTVEGDPFYNYAPVPPAFTCVDITPSGSSLPDLLEDYDPRYNRVLYNRVGLGGVLANDHLFIVAYRGSQDSRSYFAVFDTGNGEPVNTTGTGQIIAGFYLHEGVCNYSTRYCMAAMGLHTVFTLDDAPGLLAFQPSGLKNQVPGENSRYIELSNYWDGSSWKPGLPVQPAGTHTRIQITTGWNPAWGTQPVGFQPGDPVSDCTTGGCVNTGDTTGDYWHGPLQAGTLLCKDYGVPECMWVTNVISSTEVEVERGAYYGADPSYYAPQSWSSGTKIRLNNMEGAPAAISWKYQLSPKGTDPASFILHNLPGGGHSVIKNYYQNGSPDVVSYVTPGGLGVVTAQYLNSSDAPNAVLIRRGAVFGGMDAFDPGECTEGHPSVPYVRGDRIVFTDSHPIIGGPGCFNTSTSQATLVSWPVYKWSGLNIHPKHFPLLAATSGTLMKNISGPGSLLTTAASDYNKVCIALKAGECYGGSSIGDVYASAPWVRPGQVLCSNAQILDDICVGDTPSELTRISLYNAPSVSNFNNPVVASKVTGTAVLTGVGLKGKPSATTHNAKAVPGGNWMYYQALNGPRAMGLLAKVPGNWTYDGIDRTTWVPRQLHIGSGELPVGTARIAVKMGYATCPDTASDQVNCGAEFPDYYHHCSKNRAEACYVVTATVNEANPFLWASEWTSPASQSIACSTGCTVMLPSMYGRVMHFSVVYLNSSGAVIGTSPRGIEAAAWPN